MSQKYPQGETSKKIVDNGARIPHRERKNPRAREEWEKRKRATNAARGRQESELYDFGEGFVLYTHEKERREEANIIASNRFTDRELNLTGPLDVE